MTRTRSRLASALGCTIVVLVVATASPANAGRPAPEPWRLPVDGTVVEEFRAPAHAYGPGHRGVDIAPASGNAVRAAAAGTIAFAGTVVDRGVVTIDHGGGWVTSVEPVEPSVGVGEVVVAGDVIGTIGLGGHAEAGTVHVGVRRDGEYVNPLTLVGRVPRAILLPCC
ncbi:MULTISPECIES: peptidoglycan DD-metalloendopeptidase family protein [unclassified Microbacterium]|uniref:peptidoglycan DD-metalloendopeptidase family protein n=1 Tax=unclassified Microbacterium TaxID=2609290 RepID=UPI00386D9D48